MCSSDLRDAILNTNPSYVFFRINDQAGPTGAAGLALTPERSLAVDTNYVPLGTPVWLDCEHPDQNGRLQRLMIAEDNHHEIAVTGGTQVVRDGREVVGQ